MHSMPPLVTVSSPGAGRRPCRCSWRSSRYSRTLGMPSLGAYWSAIAGSSRSSRATISSRSAVGNVSGLGKPPDIESAPGGGPARIVCSSAAPRFRARWANSNIEPSALCSPRSSAATCSSQFVSSCSERCPERVCWRIAPSARPIASPVSSAASICAGGAITRPSSSPNTMSPGETSRPAKRTRWLSGARDTVVPERGSVPRAKAGSPSARRPATSRQKPSVTMPASPRRFASVANSSPNTASAPPSVAITSTSPGAAAASALITGRWSSCARTVKAGPAKRTSGTIARTVG